MHSKSLFSAVLFFAATFAQVNDYNFNEAEVSILALTRLNSAWCLMDTLLILVA